VIRWRSSTSEGVNNASRYRQALDWVEKVYKPDVKNKWDTLYKKPGYDENDP